MKVLFLANVHKNEIFVNFAGLMHYILLKSGIKHDVKTAVQSMKLYRFLKLILLKLYTYKLYSMN